jgi:hypothetical protein
LDLDGGFAGGDGQDDQAVGARNALRIGLTVELDLPGRVIAQIEDEVFAVGGCDGEVPRGRTGGLACGNGGLCRICQPEGRRAGLQAVVVGGGGGVLVGGVGAEVGMEERDAGGDGVLGKAALVEVVPGGLDEGGGEKKAGNRN